MTETRVFVYTLIFFNLIQELKANYEAWERVCDRYELIFHFPDDPVQPDPHRGDILIHDEESAARFIDRIRREAAEG